MVGATCVIVQAMVSSFVKAVANGIAPSLATKAGYHFPHVSWLSNVHVILVAEAAEMVHLD